MNNFRIEYNIAVLHLKKVLQFGATLVPICLPPPCDHTCRTWGGQTEEVIVEKEEKAFTVKYGSGKVESLQLINRTTCQSLVDGIETIKRFDFLCLINLLILLLMQ